MGFNKEIIWRIRLWKWIFFCVGLIFGQVMTYYMLENSQGKPMFGWIIILDIIIFGLISYYLYYKKSLKDYLGEQK